MVVAAGRAVGRPCAVAEIDFDNDRKLKLLDEFYYACANLNYLEIMALSRALGVWPSTVKNWKYKITLPRWDIAIDVIEWVRQGKPMKKVYQSGEEVSML
jgi:hypothetical protein